MKSILLPAAALALAVSACSGGDAGSNTAETAQQNLEAENFSTTIDSDNAVMNAADTEGLNRSGGGTTE